MEVHSRVPAINMEAKKLIQQQLILILHAHSCEQKEQQSSEDLTSECTLPYCSSTKEILRHLRGCSEGHQCSFEHCDAYHQIINHWTNCTHKKRCPICGPVFSNQITNALNAMDH